jgi:hypothetical protein
VTVVVWFDVGGGVKVRMVLEMVAIWLKSWCVVMISNDGGKSMEVVVI